MDVYIKWVVMILDSLNGKVLPLSLLYNGVHW